jgi:ureidoglycolate hydrolase
MDISPKLLEITQNTQEGYHPLTEYDRWLVAVLNEGEHNNSLEKVEYLEYHAQTDEVFMLLKGRATLLISGGQVKPEEIKKTEMEPLKCYNVKRGVWHAVVLGGGGAVAVVENSNTSRKNSCYYHLSAAQKNMLVRSDDIR